MFIINIKINFQYEFLKKQEIKIKIFRPAYENIFDLKSHKYFVKGGIGKILFYTRPVFVYIFCMIFFDMIQFIFYFSIGVIRADGPSKCLLNCAEKQFRQMAERKIQSGKASISKSAWTNVMCQCQKNCPRNRGREMVSWVGKCQHGFISQMSCLRWGCVISPPICRM